VVREHASRPAAVVKPRRSSKVTSTGNRSGMDFHRVLRCPGCAVLVLLALSRIAQMMLSIPDTSRKVTMLRFSR
jgi:hypothetical protein